MMQYKTSETFNWNTKQGMGMLPLPPLPTVALPLKQIPDPTNTTLTQLSLNYDTNHFVMENNQTITDVSTVEEIVDGNIVIRVVTRQIPNPNYGKLRLYPVTQFSGHYYDLQSTPTYSYPLVRTQAGTGNNRTETISLNIDSGTLEVDTTTNKLKVKAIPYSIITGTPSALTFSNPLLNTTGTISLNIDSGTLSIVDNKLKVTAIPYSIITGTPSALTFSNPL